MELKDWNDITVNQWYQISELLKNPDDYTSLNLLDVIYNIDSANMPITEFGKYKDALSFLNTEIPIINLLDQYTINGTTYNTNYNLTILTAAQFIDYQNYIDFNKWEDFMSIIFIPEGHKYNDGYDMTKVKHDIQEMPITFVRSLVFFYTMQLSEFTKHFLSSLTHSIKEMNLTKEQELKILKELQKLDLLSLE